MTYFHIKYQHRPPTAPAFDQPHLLFAYLLNTSNGHWRPRVQHTSYGLSTYQIPTSTTDGSSVWLAPRTIYLPSSLHRRPLMAPAFNTLPRNYPHIRYQQRSLTTQRYIYTTYVLPTYWIQHRPLMAQTFDLPYIFFYPPYRYQHRPLMAPAFD